MLLLWFLLTFGYKSDGFRALLSPAPSVTMVLFRLWPCIALEAEPDMAFAMPKVFAERKDFFAEPPPDAGAYRPCKAD
jgi:hypothetical protein